MAEISMRIDPGKDVCIVHVAGEVDLDCAGKLAAVGRLGVGSDASVLSVDMHDVTFLDSTGIGALIQIRNAVLARHKRLVLSSPSDHVSKVLHVAGLAGVFGISSSAH